MNISSYIEFDLSEAEAPILRVTPIGVLANDSKTSGIQRSFDSASQKKRLSSGYQSPLDRWFCESVSSDVSKVYDVCVSKCEEATGWYSRCTETVFEKRCGCKQGRPRKKGVMTYEVIILLFFFKLILSVSFVIIKYVY